MCFLHNCQHLKQLTWETRTKQGLDAAPPSGDQEWRRKWQSSRWLSLCVYLWKQRNSENKDPISVITSNNSLVGFFSLVRPLCLSLCPLASGVQSKPQTATIQLLYSAQTYGRKNVRPECMQIHKITFFLFLIKIQKLTIGIKARPSTKKKETNRGGLQWQQAVQLSVRNSRRGSLSSLILADQRMIGLSK